MATAKKVPTPTKPAARTIPPFTKLLRSTAKAATGAKPVAKGKVKTADAKSKPTPPPKSQPAIKSAAAKPLKVKKPKLVRDSFTIPKLEYSVLEDLKQRSARLTNPAKKSELLRAGIKALAAMPDADLVVALRAVPAIKTGRPSKV